MNNVMIVIVGASGDLTKRKLIPAIYQLIQSQKLSSWFVIGVGKEHYNSGDILESARPYISDLNQKTWQQLNNHFAYYPCDVTDAHVLKQLKEKIEYYEKQYNLSGNRLIYLAVASDLFCVITKMLCAIDIVQRQSHMHQPWHRIIYEKPFGYDLNSAQEMNHCIQGLLSEEQMYRIDHYLTKEMINTIALVRFTNIVFEPLWNNRYIDQVQIILSEKNDVQDRGNYYDKYGAVRDVVQNHMLEIMALIAMESPKKLTGEYIRNERVKVLQQFSFIDGTYGQYIGYRDASGVKRNSSTETFAVLYGQIRNPRWTGVPFYFKTGKALDRHETIIHVKFKQVDCLLTRSCPQESNLLTIRVFPEAKFSLQLNVKKPDSAQEVVPIKMEYCHSCLFQDHIAYAHEVLLEEVMRGQTSVSVRFDEIESAWHIVDALKQKNLSLGYYQQGSQGPKEMYDFMNKYGIRWRP